MNKYEWKNIITCSFCKNKYKTPVILPCFETICNNDVKILCQNSNNNNKFFCIFCDDMHYLPEYGFKEDKKMQKFLNINIEELNLDNLEKHKEAKRSCNELEKSLDELDFLNEKPSDYLHDYISDLKNKIDLKREELKEQIDKKYEIIIQEIETFYFKCNQQLENSTKISNSNDQTIREKLFKWNTLLNKISLDEKNWESIDKQAKECEKEVKKRINFQKEKILQNKIYKIDTVRSSEELVSLIFNAELVNYKKIGSFDSTWSNNINKYSFVEYNY